MKSNSKEEMSSDSSDIPLKVSRSNYIFWVFWTRYSGSELNTFLGIFNKSSHASRSLTNLIWRGKTSRTPRWLWDRSREKGRENQSKSFHESCLWFVWKKKDPCMHIYRRQVGVEGEKCNKRIKLLDNFLQTSPYFIIYLDFRIFVQLEGSLLREIFWWSNLLRLMWNFYGR
jgi:hypothetical protein